MRISSENVFSSGSLPRFLCDVMLARLARYLRAAGYDTASAADGAADRDIIRQAAEECRWLLTMDRKIRDHKAARGLLVVLMHPSLDAQARELHVRFAMNWTERAFSRCVLDNCLLEALGDAESGRVPDDVRQSGQPLMRCPSCGRVYWRGSHYRRMMGRLLRWQNCEFVCTFFTSQAASEHSGTPYWRKYTRLWKSCCLGRDTVESAYPEVLS